MCKYFIDYQSQDEALPEALPHPKLQYEIERKTEAKRIIINNILGEPKAVFWIVSFS